MENVNIILAANILKYRKENGLSQEELAQKLGIYISSCFKMGKCKGRTGHCFFTNDGGHIRLSY